ncbi:MAG: HupE/UreJ family protein [Deltaproteobacteria bacterium]|nr:HupE/UreJ family protein [Deltaproteobacteria bacterium]
MPAAVQHLIALIIPAHVPVKNISEFYAGILHPLIVPAHVLAIIIAGFVAARIPAYTLSLTRSFAGGLLVGLCASGLGLRVDETTALLILMIIFLSGVYVAANLPHLQKYATNISYGLAISAGILVGLDTVFNDLDGAALWWCLLGTLVGASVMSFVVARFARLARQPWQHIAVRVAASWIAAIGLLMLALALAG